MAVEPTLPVQGLAVETEALKALQFYLHNYTTLMFTGLGPRNKKIILGSKPFGCRFCGGKPPKRTFDKRAHAVSELLGNKIMVSLYECDDCMSSGDIKFVVSQLQRLCDDARHRHPFVVRFW